MSKVFVVGSLAAIGIVGWILVVGPDSTIVKTPATVGEHTANTSSNEVEIEEQEAAMEEAMIAMVTGGERPQRITPERSEDEAIQSMLNHQQFQQEMQSILSQGENVDPETVQKLQSDLDELVAEDMVTPFEELMIRLALIKNSVDESTFETLSEQMMADYEARVDMEKSTVQPDSRHLTYKEQERKVVQEVLSMSHYPDGLSRDDYLRKRLDEVRSEIYSMNE